MKTQASAAQVLLVEDDALLADAIVRVLREDSISIHLVQSVEAAKELDLGSFDVLLLDIKLPGQDGIAFLKYLSEQKSTAKVIIISNLSDEALVAQACTYDICDYVIKSNISLKGVLEKVKQVIDSGTCQHPFDCVQYNGG